MIFSPSLLKQQPELPGTLAMLEPLQTLLSEDVLQPAPQLHQSEITLIGPLPITVALTIPMMMVMEVRRMMIFQEVLIMIHLMMMVLVTILTTPTIPTIMYNTIYQTQLLHYSEMCIIKEMALAQISENQIPLMELIQPNSANSLFSYNSA